MSISLLQELNAGIIKINRDNKTILFITIYFFEKTKIITYIIINTATSNMNHIGRLSKTPIKHNAAATRQPIE